MDKCDVAHCTCGKRLGSKRIGQKTRTSRLGCDTFDALAKEALTKTPEGRKLFNAIERTVETEHSDVLYKKTNHLLVHPRIFQYSHLPNEDIKEDPFVEDIQQIKQGMTRTISLTMEDEDELKLVRRVIGHYLPQFGEWDVHQALTTSFYEERGLLLHGYKIGTYLHEFVKLAKDMRNKDWKTPLTPLEEGILSLYGIRVGDVDQWVKQQMQVIRNVAKGINSPIGIISGQIIRQALKLDQNDLKRIVGKERLVQFNDFRGCLLYTSPSPRDATLSRMPSSA